MRGQKYKLLHKRYMKSITLNFKGYFEKSEQDILLAEIIIDWVTLNKIAAHWTILVMIESGMLPSQKK